MVVCVFVMRFRTYLHVGHVSASMVSDFNVERKMAECEEREDDMIAQPPRKKPRTRRRSKNEVNTICKELSLL